MVNERGGEGSTPVHQFSLNFQVLKSLGNGHFTQTKRPQSVIFVWIFASRVA